MTEKVKSLVFSLAFVLVFGSVGLFAGYVIFNSISLGMRAQDWILVKADITNYGQGNITYRYKLGEQEYTGRRAGTFLLGGVENITDVMYDRVQQAYADKKPLTIYVNPDNPSESVIDRNVNYKGLLLFLPFMLGFGGVALGALIIGIRDLLPESEARRRQKAKGEAMNGLVALWIFAFVWNAMAIPVSLVFVPEAIYEGEYLKLLLLAFPLVGLLILWGAIHGTWKAISGNKAAA